MTEPFLSAPPKYRREIAVALAAKAVALAILYLLFFRAPTSVSDPAVHLFSNNPFPEVDAR